MTPKVGLCPLFLFGGIMDNNSIVSQVWELATPLVVDEGLEVFDIEFRREGQGWVLRLFLEKEGGPSLADLTRVSRQLSDLFDVHDILQRAYTLEVSSPGVNRLLKRPEHFNRYVGEKIRIRTREMIKGRRSYLGLLKQTNEEGVVLLQDGMEVVIPYPLIERANYEYQWDQGIKHKE